MDLGKKKGLKYKIFRAKKRVLPIKRYLSRGRFEKLLRYVEKRGTWARRRGSKRAIIDELIILILAYTGLRVKELRVLNIGDVIVKEPGFIVVQSNKGKISRQMIIPTGLAKKLERFINLYRQEAKKTDPLFLNEQGNRLGYISIYSKTKMIGVKSGVGNLHPHMLRHTFLMGLFKAEKDLKLVQKQAGYNSIKAAEIYLNTDVM